MSITQHFSLQLIAPQIILLEIPDGIELELNDAIEMIRSATELAGGKKYAVLFDATKSGTISMEAREAFARSPKRIAAAILTNSLANKLMSNFFIKFHRPSSPTLIFSEYSKAVEWLKVQVSMLSSSDQ